MKAFFIALTVLTLLICGVVVNDVYCSDVCNDVIKMTENGSYEEALEIFKRNEQLLKLSVDNGYVVEARVSLESLFDAYEHNDDYEIARYTSDSCVRIERIRKSLFI